MKSYCHYEKVEGVGRVFIPGCIGGAVYGKDGCTCDRETYEKTLEERLSILERKVDKILKMIAK